MKYIKKFEKYVIPNTDSPEVSSDKDYFNNLEDNIKEYNTKKTTLQNIYMTYTNQDDLVKKLFSQKFINSNTTPTKDSPRKFMNPLLDLWSQVCQKMRDTKNIQDQITSEKGTINQKNDLISQNPNVADSANQSISNSNSNITDLNQQLSKINTSITILKKQTEDELAKMKKELTISKSRIDYTQNK
jgi:hypothetical protein